MMNFTLRSAIIAASSLVLLGTLPAQAGADAVRAEAYFNAISGGNADTITSFYADDAEFHWIGGPLAGKYKGKDKIKGVWKKFSQAAGKLDHKVLQLSESANGKTSTVTARVMFKADSEVPVKFIMVYKDGKIASEVWQVDRSGAAEAKAEPKTEAKDEPKTEAKPAPAAADAPVQADGQPQREAANAPAADAPAPDGAPADKAPEAQNAPTAEAAAPAPAEAGTQAATTAPETNAKAQAKPASEPKGKYAGDKKDGYAAKNDGYGDGYERKAYKPKKHYYGHGGYGHGHRHGGYGWYGGYGHGGYGRGYGHY
jgi:ketosteroid isomerase-like protein